MKYEEIQKRERYHYFLLIDGCNPIWLCSCEVFIYQKRDLYSYINEDFEFFWSLFEVIPLPDNPEKGFESLIDIQNFKSYLLKLILTNTVFVKEYYKPTETKFIFV